MMDVECKNTHPPHFGRMLKSPISVVVLLPLVLFGNIKPRLIKNKKIFAGVKGSSKQSKRDKKKE